jgi:hypothetical protein
MKSSAVGRSTSQAEITNVSGHGVWLLVNSREYFLPFELYPWFRNARVHELLDVVLLHGSHLHWPKLDVDLEIESLDNTESYPLVYH